MVKAVRSVRRMVAWALVLAAATPAAAQLTHSRQARVVGLNGTATLQRGRSTPQSLRLNDAVLPGDEVVTGENSTVRLRTSTGATVEIFPDSRIIYSEQSADIREFLHLFFGSIKVYIEKLTGRPNPHSITTPTAVIAVRGTVFSVFVDENDSTLVAVEEGVVSVVNPRFPGQEVLLRAGQRAWVQRGGPPAQAQAFRGRSERADLIPMRDRGMGMGGARRRPAAAQHPGPPGYGHNMGSMPGHSPGPR